MGRTTLTYRQRLQLEMERWKGFRQALLAHERRAFEGLVDRAFRYIHAGMAYPDRDVFDLFTMSSLLSHEERLLELERELKMGMRVDSRLSP
ncbi:hypothetical protein HRbin01_00732 [archaeon HR01]|nr:hypothetical protein HRbin01_00732 [archaeon HR01]